MRRLVALLREFWRVVRSPAGGLSLGFIDVFDIASGSGTGNNIAPTSTIPLDHGQVNLVTMTYSAVTNTVLMVEPGPKTALKQR